MFVRHGDHLACAEVEAEVQLLQARQAAQDAPREVPPRPVGLQAQVCQPREAPQPREATPRPPGDPWGGLQGVQAQGVQARQGPQGAHVHAARALAVARLQEGRSTHGFVSDVAIDANLNKVNRR